MFHDVTWGVHMHVYWGLSYNKLSEWVQIGQCDVPGKACSAVVMGKLAWQLSQKETYCHCQLKSTWVAEHVIKKDMRTLVNTFVMILQCRHSITSPLTFHLQTSPVFHQKSEWCWCCNLWRRFRCFGDVICHFCTSSFAIDCGVHIVYCNVL